jgi:hypothetical protein
METPIGRHFNENVQFRQEQHFSEEKQKRYLNLISD